MAPGSLPPIKLRSSKLPPQITEPFLDGSVCGSHPSQGESGIQGHPGAGFLWVNDCRPVIRRSFGGCGGVFFTLIYVFMFSSSQLSFPSFGRLIGPCCARLLSGEEPGRGGAREDIRPFSGFPRSEPSPGGGLRVLPRPRAAAAPPPPGVPGRAQAPRRGGWIPAF